MATSFVIITFQFCVARQAKAVVPNQLRFVSQINQKRVFSGNFIRQLGFINGEQAVFENVEGILENKGQIVIWNVQSQRKQITLPFSPWVDNYTLALSLDGKRLVANNSRVSSIFPRAKTYRTTIIRSSSLTVEKQKIYSKNEDSGELFFVAEDNEHVVISATSLVLRRGTLDYGTSRLDWLNLKTGKIDKTLLYWPANEVDKIFCSSDKKYLLGLFYSEPLNPYGKSDYAPLQNKLERQGFVDVIDPKTGKILWHLEGTDKQPVGDPLFFISPTRFISSDTVFNIATKTARPWNAITPTRKCLAAVPGHSNTAMFLTPGGLQLRDWQKDKLLVSWPTVKQPGHIMFSPDLKMFSFKRDSIIQFWKFDPKWLK